MDNKIYQLDIYFNENIEDINISELENFIQNDLEYVNREYIFYDKVSLEVYNPFTLNSYIRYTFNINPLILKEKLEKFEYIKNVNLTSYTNKVSERGSNITISVDKIPEIVDDVDNIFYIRKKLSKFTTSIVEDKRHEYTSLLKELSELKYNLKRNIFQLRIVDIEKEIENIYRVLKEYINILGIDIDLEIKHNDIKIDKIIFNRFRESLIDILYAEILEFYDLENKGNKFVLKIEFKQELDKLSIYIIGEGKSININKVFENAINTNILKPNYEYSETEILKSIFNKNYINSSDELDEKERLISYIKYKNIINDLKGSIELENKQGLYTKIITKIPMDIIFVKGLVFNEGKSTYVINKDLVEDIFEFNSENIINLNGLQYYKYENKNIGYISLPIEKFDDNNRCGLLIKSGNRFTIIDINASNIFEEDIYFQKKEDSQIFIGECLLKSIKRAKILNVKNIIKFFKG